MGPLPTLATYVIYDTKRMPQSAYVPSYILPKHTEFPSNPIHTVGYIDSYVNIYQAEIYLHYKENI